MPLLSSVSLRDRWAMAEKGLFPALLPCGNEFSESLYYKLFLQEKPPLLC
jgi:hypothetical protein